MDPKKISIDRTFQHPYIRTHWVPGFQSTYSIEGIGGQSGTMEFKINEFGFRSRSMKTAQKPDHTQRLFFLGGSTTECVYLAEEKTFASLVEKKLRDAFPNQKFEAVNAGSSSYLAADAFVFFVYKVLYFQPDMIFVMLAVNDLRYGCVPTYDPVNRPNYEKILYRSDFDEGTWRRIAKILKNSHFLTLIKWRIINRFFPPDAEKYKTKIEEYNIWRQRRRQKPLTEIKESKALPDFLKYMEEMIFVAQGHGIRVILMTEPFIYQPNMPRKIDEQLWMGYIEEANINLSSQFLLREMNRFNDAVRELARTHNVELIDLEREIPKDLRHFYDDVHFTPEGSRKAAEVISSYLLANKDKMILSPKEGNQKITF